MKPLPVIIIAVVVGVASFYGGMQYQSSKQFSGRNFAAFGQQGGMGKNGMATGGSTGRRIGNQPISGEIISIDTDSLTVKLTDGSSRIVLLNDKTIYNKTASVEKTELKMGEKVGIFGTANTDGSMNAQNVQLNPQFRMGGAAGAGGNVGNPVR